MSGPGHWFIDSLFLLLLLPSISFVHTTTSSFASPPGVRQHWRCFVTSLAAQVQHKNVWGSVVDVFDRDFFGTLPDTKEADVAFVLDDFPNLTSVPWLPSLPKSFPSRVWRHVQPQPFFMDPCGILWSSAEGQLHFVRQSGGCGGSFDFMARHRIATPRKSSLR